MLLKWRDEAFFRNMKLNQKVKWIGTVVNALWNLAVVLVPLY